MTTATIPRIAHWNAVAPFVTDQWQTRTQIRQRSKLGTAVVLHGLAAGWDCGLVAKKADPECRWGKFVYRLKGTA